MLQNSVIEHKMEIIVIESDAFYELERRVIDEMKKEMVKSLQEEPIEKVELCRRLNICSRTVEYYKTKGWLPYHKIGHKVIFFWSEILQSMESFNIHEEAK